MKPRRQLLNNPAEEHGAALILVLVVVTIIGVAGAALLTFSDTSIRTTVALRDQAAAASAADGAAQVVVSQIESGKLACTPTTPKVVTLGSAATPFYVPVQSRAGSLNATITCSPDMIEGATPEIPATEGSINSHNIPHYALATVGSNEGQTYAGNQTICVSGGSVLSNHEITVGRKGSKNSLSVGVKNGEGDCPVTADPKTVSVEAADKSGCNEQADNDDVGDFPVTPCKHRSSPLGLDVWKDFAPIPNASIKAKDINPPAICASAKDNVYAAFVPGYYSEVDLLNLPCFEEGKKGKGKPVVADFEWFSPGTYYFDFADPWSWTTTLVAGTPLDSSSGDALTVDATDEDTLSLLSKVTSFPGSCADPRKQSKYPGVEFVFGGSSTIVPNETGRNEICATYSAKSPPVAIYGVSSEVIGANSLDVGDASVKAQTLCDQDKEVVPCTSSSTGGEPLIEAGMKDSFFIQGFTYAPSASISLTQHKGSEGQVFGWGLLSRSVDMTVNGGTSSAPYVVLRPEPNGTTAVPGKQTIRYLSVWTCAATDDACPRVDADDKPIPANVRVKVQTLTDGKVKVLSWSVQR